MVLGFGSSSIFKKSFDNNELKPRFAQDGSVPVADGDTNISTNTTIYTVNTQKVLYVTDVTIISNINHAGADHIQVSDGPGTTHISIALGSAVTGDKWIFSYPTPIKFLSTVFATATDSPDVDINFTGWEEDRG